MRMQSLIELLGGQLRGEIEGSHEQQRRDATAHAVGAQLFTVGGAEHVALHLSTSVRVAGVLRRRIGDARTRGQEQQQGERGLPNHVAEGGLEPLTFGPNKSANTRSASGKSRPLRLWARTAWARSSIKLFSGVRSTSAPSIRSP